jgi:hypothetical protein
MEALRSLPGVRLSAAASRSPRGKLSTGLLGYPKTEEARIFLTGGPDQVFAGGVKLTIHWTPNLSMSEP